MATPARTRLVQRLGIHAVARAGRRADGSRATAGWLGRLPEGWHLFNEIPSDGQSLSIDHLLVAPAGVFTVQLRSLTGKIWVASQELRHNGHKTSFLPKAVAEAKRASKLLSATLQRPIEVHPVLAILADDWTIKERPTDVLVAAPRGVKDWLRSQPRVLSPGEVVTISAAVSEPATWQRSGPV
jgi:hypothetical protein